jgi:DNA mismatch endonuclease (patch repair protein)
MSDVRTPASTAHPSASSPGVSDRMRRQARQDTEPEVELRRRLFAQGLRYRVHVPIPGMPRRSMDVAFPRARVAVFVDGCFWHGCPEHATYPVANSAWWGAKLARNVERDTETAEHLQVLGWHVHRIWEHEDPAVAADELAKLVAARLRGT